MQNSLVIGGIAVVLVGLLLWWSPPGGAPVSENAHATAPAVSASDAAAGPRTVIVVAEGEPRTSAVVRERVCGASSLCPNGADGIAIAVLKNGVIPKQPTAAVVETDTNCDPDQYGISHCSNILRLPDGSTIAVRHDHNMQAYPCLNPGDTVTVEGQRTASS